MFYLFLFYVYEGFAGMCTAFVFGACELPHECWERNLGPVWLVLLYLWATLLLSYTPSLCPILGSTESTHSSTARSYNASKWEFVQEDKLKISGGRGPPGGRGRSVCPPAWTTW